MDKIEIRPPTETELARVQQLRHVVLDPARVIESDTKLTAEDYDEKNIHIAAFEAGNVIGTVRLDLLTTEPKSYEVRKVAVDPGYQGKGIGRLVVLAALNEAQSRGAVRFTLDARKEAVAFFEKLGFVESGVHVIHADGVPNYVMARFYGGILGSTALRAPK